MSKIETHFRFFQGLLAALHIGAALSLAIYAEREDKDWTTDVLTEYNAWVGPKNSSCASGDGCFIYSVEENFSSSPLSLIWATASFSLISGFHHLIACVFFDWYLEKCVHSGVNVVRWIDYAGSSAIMFAVISILFMAPPTITGLVSAYILQFLVVVAGAGSDVAWKLSSGSIPGYSYSKGLFYTTLVAYVFPWAFLIAQYQIAVDAHPKADSCGVAFPENAEKKDPPAFVTAAIIGLFATFSLFALVQGEYFFSLLSFVSKISLLGNVAAGVIGRSDNNISLAPPAQNGTLAFSSSTDGDDTDLFDTFLWSSVGASAFLGLVMLGSAYYIGFESYANTVIFVRPPLAGVSYSTKNIASTAKLVF